MQNIINIIHNGESMIVNVLKSLGIHGYFSIQNREL